MAAKNFACDLCDLEFAFQSKFQRHLDSAGHRRFSSIHARSDQEEVMVTEPLDSIPQEEEDAHLYQVVSL